MLQIINVPELIPTIESLITVEPKVTNYNKLITMLPKLQKLVEKGLHQLSAENLVIELNNI
jgi:hypothetical protein